VQNSFVNYIKPHYTASDNSICLGGILYDNKVVENLDLNISLKSLNRHGLISGATGTGKTKTIQMLSEQLSEQGVPTLLMDMKGDLSGLAMPGESNETILKRQKELGLGFNPVAFPVELLSMGEQPGVKIRATLIEFGPLLFSRMLDLNETQTSIISILFQYAKENDLLLLDLADIKQLISYAQNEGKKTIESTYGGVSASSLKSILRRIIELESQGGDEFFGEPSFDVCDLLQLDAQGKGVISILRLMDLQDRPKLFSTFMLGLLTSVYSTLPEIGDPDKPKIVIFIDEAHLIFNHASKALLNYLENMVKLIRSKGVGLIFCTQSPNDIPEGVLSQLGLKVQHALRAFTAKDRKGIKLVAENFPISSYYDIVSLLTSLGTGKALITGLDVNGQPTPLAAGMIRAPHSRMGPISQSECANLIAQSHLVKKYNTRLERESAMEKLRKRIAENPYDTVTDLETEPGGNESALETLSKNTLFRQVIRTITREITRAIMSALGLSKKRRKRRK